MSQKHVADQPSCACCTMIGRRMACLRPAGLTAKRHAARVDLRLPHQLSIAGFELIVHANREVTGNVKITELNLLILFHFFPGRIFAKRELSLKLQLCRSFSNTSGLFLPLGHFVAVEALSYSRSKVAKCFQSLRSFYLTLYSTFLSLTLVSSLSSTCYFPFCSVFSLYCFPDDRRGGFAYQNHRQVTGEQVRSRISTECHCF